jgi:hypothetical protein
MELKAKIKSGTIVILVLIGIGFLSITFYMYTLAMETDYIQIGWAILSLLFGVFGIFSVLSIFLLNVFVISGDKLIIKSVFGYIKNEINILDIVSFTEIEKESKYDKWKELVIFTQISRYKISSNLTENFEQFKNAIIQGKQREVHYENLWRKRVNRNLGIGFLTIGLLFVILFINGIKNSNDRILEKDLTTIESIITNKIEIIRPSKGSPYIKIELKDFPNFLFNVSNNVFYATNTELFNSNVKKGDTLFLAISKEEFETKITKEISPGFLTKHFNYQFISPYKIWDKKNIYLDLNAYNEINQSDNKASRWIVLLICLFFIGSGVFFLLKNRSL